MAGPKLGEFIGPLIGSMVVADGGVIARNPSRVGGTWAWCEVVVGGSQSDADLPIDGASGVLLTNGGMQAAEALQNGGGFAAVVGGSRRVVGWPHDEVTNNSTEYVAVLFAIESLPDGWSGLVCSDSQVTLGRFFRGWSREGIPDEWSDRGQAAMSRLGKLEPVLLDGHPSEAHLRSGRGSRGHHVSVYNRICDRLCGLRAVELIDVDPIKRRAAAGEIMVIERNAMSSGKEGPF